MKISCVCCTYGRFAFMKRSIACWLNQDYDDAELIVFNTAEESLVLDKSLHDRRIRIINQCRDTTDGLPYRSLGLIRRDAAAHATGKVYVCWDDEDLYLPWHLSQGAANLMRCGRGAWMPAQSYFSNDGGRTYLLSRNAFEASVLVWTDYLFRYGFDIGKSGAEHLSWRMAMVADGHLSESDEVTPPPAGMFVSRIAWQAEVLIVRHTSMCYGMNCQGTQCSQNGSHATTDPAKLSISRRYRHVDGGGT
jgi:hypothetical protein